MMTKLGKRFPNTLHTLVEHPDTESVAQALCDELADLHALPCVWLGIKNAGSEFTTMGLSGTGSLLTAFKNTKDPWIGSHSGGPAANTLIAGQTLRMSLGDAALDPWRQLLRNDAIQGVLGLPIVLSNQQVGVCLLFGRQNAAWLNAHAGEDFDLDNLADEMVWVFERQAEHERRAILERALNSAGNSIFLTNADANIVWANPAFSMLTGYEQHEVIGRNPRFLQSGRQGKRYYRNLWQTVSSGRVWTSEVIDKDKHGYLYTINQTISPVTTNGHVTHYLSIHEDISRRRVIRLEHERANPIDERTGLLNATAFRDRIVEELSAPRESGENFYVVSLVLQTFNSAVELLGNELVDQVLEIVGERIRGVLSERDIAGHLNRADFGLLLRSMNNREQALDVVDHIIFALREPIPLLGEDMYFGPQFGIAEYPTDGMDADTLWSRADDSIATQPI